MFVTNFDGPLLDCALRMVRLLNTPPAIPHIYPSIMREICYWLLTGPHGGEVFSMTISKTHTSSILNAIHLLRDHYTEPIGIDQLASLARMSASAFQRQFKAITSMTPLQYQKQLRLLKARRLMVADEKNVKTAAFEVGYESPTQFSREYARMFGMPPRRDTLMIRYGSAHTGAHEPAASS